MSAMFGCKVATSPFKFAFIVTFKVYAPGDASVDISVLQVCMDAQRQEDCIRIGYVFHSPNHPVWVVVL